MSYPRYEIFKDARNEFRFNLKAKNYEVILTASEGYVNKPDCKNAINICQKNSPHDKSYDRRTSANSKPYFTLKSDNGRDIGRSEEYNTIAGREGGIIAVKADGQTQTVIDLT